LCGDGDVLTLCGSMGLPPKDQLGAPIRHAPANAAEQARARLTGSRVTVSSDLPGRAPAGSRQVGQPPARAFAPYARTPSPVSSALCPSESPAVLTMPDGGSAAVPASVAGSSAPPVIERSAPSSPVDCRGSWSDASAAHHEDLPWTHGRVNSAFDRRLPSSASAAGQTVLAPALLRRCVPCTACAAIPRY
jgi:hypothetical protein